MVFTSHVGRGNESPTPAPEKEELFFFQTLSVLPSPSLSYDPWPPQLSPVGPGPLLVPWQPCWGFLLPFSVSASLCPFLVPLSVSPISQAEQRGTYGERQEEKLPAPLWMLQESQTVGKDSEAQRSGVSLPTPCTSCQARDTLPRLSSAQEWPQPPAARGEAWLGPRTAPSEKLLQV